MLRHISAIKFEQKCFSTMFRKRATAFKPSSSIHNINFFLMYEPKSPLKFDHTGKMLIYDCREKVSGMKNLQFIAGSASCIPLYCLARAIQKRSLWRIALWTIPAMLGGRMIWVSKSLTTQFI